ncbi:aspartate carbamoyltransferase [Herbidospora sp. NEAU-GS84]|uniref:Aspartate carbamoyltransferase n=1 Tax=Herbidospora solisilvae TaxID=2696284 RepID=A0A7C9NGH1_9ACTN|nr:aspartate carbamoyltransferase [Herbidospora solisilvae]NAS24495.1 aspartate carbamoyltransferase [Herbidospora solisilvae]
MNLRRRRVPLLLAGLAVIAAASAGYALSSQSDQREARALADRQAEVAARSRQVMPFDLERTTHRFDKTGTGGLQTVTAKDPGDAPQVKLIRAHLSEEVTRFSKGDFGDPASIHGGQMPGLSALEEGHDRIDVRYAEASAGAQITYTTSDPALISALHAWFDAQVTDHGQHAEHE